MSPAADSERALRRPQSSGFVAGGGACGHCQSQILAPLAAGAKADRPELDPRLVLETTASSIVATRSWRCLGPR